MLNVQDLFRTGMRTMAAFDAFEPWGAVRMHLNEGLPLSDSFGALLADFVRSYLAEGGGLHRYSEVVPRGLQRAFAEFLGVPAENVEVTGGSTDSILLLASACFTSGRRIAFPTPSYYLFEQCIHLFDAVGVPYPMPLPFAERQAETRARLFSDEVMATDIAILCNPNNPTGSVLPAAWTLEFLDRYQGFVLVDEAYIEYAETMDHVSLVNEAAQRPNVVVLRTLSKAWAAAGLRLSAIVASPPVIAQLAKIRTYRLSALTEAIGEWMLTEHVATMRASVAETLRVKRLMRDGLTAIQGIEVFDTMTNFLLFRCADAATLESYLLDKERMAVCKLAGGDLEHVIRLSTPDEASACRLVDSVRAWAIAPHR